MFDAGEAAFDPDARINSFVKAAILAEDGFIHNPDHLHLIEANILYLWTTAPNSRRGRRIIGEAEVPTYRVPKWQKARLECQIEQWAKLAGIDWPDFIITLDANFAGDCTAGELLALIEHELYHCGQAVDEFGFPKFRKDDGRPMFAIKGHDIEEFTGVVRRYGLKCSDQDARDFVAAALEVPELEAVFIRSMCGVE